MEFINELTYENYFKNNKINIFHKKFDDAIINVKNSFGDVNYPNIIDNKKIYTNNKYKHTSPIDNRIIIGFVSKITDKLIKKAIDSSHQSFKNWSRLDYHDRIKILRKAANIMKTRKFQLAALLTFENGKNRYESIADIDEAIDFINYYCYDMMNNNGYITVNTKKNKGEKNLSYMKPYGVWGIISPFNFPAAILVGMSIGAIISGNTAVIKPASNTPIIGLKIAEILIEAGIQPGVFNYVIGDADIIGSALIDNNKISGIVFTGSKDVGFKIFKNSSTVKPRPIIAELGGKNPTIVTESADLDKAAEGVSKAAFSYGGQKCSACSRVYVQKNKKNIFIEKLISKVTKINIDNPKNINSDLGPVINSATLKNFKKFVNIAKKDGKILYGGKIVDKGDFKYGNYVMPTIVTDLPDENILLKKELFLPILCIDEYDSFEEGLSKCNNSEFGLTAGIYSNDKEEINEFVNNIEAGVVYVNRQKSSTTGALVGNQSFGGWKNSGISGKGTGGKYYLIQFMREQSHTIIQTN